METEPTQLQSYNTVKEGRKPHLPAWLKVRPAPAEKYGWVNATLTRLGLVTVCESAKCPNRRECWGRGTATFMICGAVCTRGCKFCSVTPGRPNHLDPDEPRRVAEAVHVLGLKYVVITSVTRDDLPDGGAGHFCATVKAIKGLGGDVAVEVLTPDFRGKIQCIVDVVQSGVKVFAHNIETVRRLTPVVRSQADYDRSLDVLAVARKHAPEGVYIKSGFMVGLGETFHEVEQTLRDLRRVGCDIITIGQYLRPAIQCLPVAEFVPPAKFAQYAELGRRMGFKMVFSGPLVRSSYLAERVLECDSPAANGINQEP